MPTLLNPYISFKDNAREAMEFYHSILGGKLDMNSFAEGGMPDVDPADANKLMHGMITTDTGLVLMASDTPTGMQYTDGARVSISLSGEDEAELSGYFNKLSEGGNVVMPLEKAPWGDTFGMVTDKFGINWMVNINAQPSQ
jgi:PhnB protein